MDNYSITKILFPSLYKEEHALLWKCHPIHQEERQSPILDGDKRPTCQSFTHQHKFTSKFLPQTFRNVSFVTLWLVIFNETQFRETKVDLNLSRLGEMKEEKQNLCKGCIENKLNFGLKLMHSFAIWRTIVKVKKSGHTLMLFNKKNLFFIWHSVLCCKAVVWILKFLYNFKL